MATHRYQHTALSDPEKQIRLLQATDAQDELSYAVCHWNLEGAPDYIAISYTWGDPHDTSTISLDGSTLVVRRNSRHALSQVKAHYPAAHVWIDAICINQGDVTEKSAQVNIMGLIYEKASKVTACIGSHDEASLAIDGVIRSMSQGLSHLVEFDETHLQDRPGVLLRRLGTTDSTEGIAWLKQHFGSDDNLVDLFSKYNDFMARPYWSRLWILQEVFYGTIQNRPEVLCGDAVWPWPNLTMLNDILGWTIWRTPALRDSDLPKDWALGIGAYPFVLATTPSKKSVFEVIAWFPYFGCYDARDHV